MERILLERLVVCLALTACSEGASTSSGSGTPASAVDETTFARAVVALNSCNFDDGFLRTTTYFRGKQGGFQYLDIPLACVASVTNGCTGVFACQGVSSAPTSQAPGQCTGNVASIGGTTWDCDVVHATCQAGSCARTGETPCDGATFVSSCDAEGRPNDCMHVVQRGPVCASLGLVCNADDKSKAYCSGTGAACSGSDLTYFDVAPKGTACNGKTIAACVGGHMADLDCGLLGDGFGCQAAQGAFFCGLASECDPVTFGKHCEGASVVFCDAGKLQKVDCAAFGFTGCGAKARACDWTP